VAERQNVPAAISRLRYQAYHQDGTRVRTRGFPFRRSPTMRTYTLNVTDFSGFVQPAAEVNAEDGDVAKYSKVFAKQLGENQPEFLNRGLCVATCDETGTIQCVAPIDTIH
jgi:hypothetical protein